MRYQTALHPGAVILCATGECFGRDFGLPRPTITLVRPPRCELTGCASEWVAPSAFWNAVAPIAAASASADVRAQYARVRAAAYPS